MEMPSIRAATWITDALCFGAFVALALALAVRVVAGVDEPSDAGLVVVGAIAGWALSDLVAGLVHWFCDTFFEADTPGIGPPIIAPFREHHRDPLAMTRRSFLEVNRTNYVAVLPVLALVVWLGDPVPAGAAAVAVAGTLFFAAGIALTNQFHQWAHARHAPRIARWLQRARLAIDPAHHIRHHASGGVCAFCVTTGWWNPLLDALPLSGRPSPSSAPSATSRTWGRRSRRGSP
jgi:ubiquitin-conjugating enzyme E2 variant